MITTEKVREYCYQSLDKATPDLQSFFKIHMKDVLEKAKQLAKTRGADEEIVEIAAWLHDIGSIQGNHENHDKVGADIAENFLQSINYPAERIEKVKRAILNHRGSKPREVKTKEEQILIDADAMSHFIEVEKLMEKYYPTKKALLDKLERSYSKMSEQAKAEIAPLLEKFQKEFSE